jgi:hypothetical protein
MSMSRVRRKERERQRKWKMRKEEENKGKTCKMTCENNGERHRAYMREGEGNVDRDSNTKARTGDIFLEVHLHFQNSISLLSFVLR